MGPILSRGHAILCSSWTPGCIPFMENGSQPSKWISVEEYAADAELHPSELVSMILDGRLPGERQGDRWYVAAPLVLLEPTQSDDGTALLTLSACCIGSYVTAGRGSLQIPLRFFGDPGRAAALATLNAAIEEVPNLPVAITLNGEHFHVDSSLWVDLGAALVEFESLMSSLSWRLS